MLPNLQQGAEWLWKLTVLLAAVHLLAVLLRRRSAAERHALWLLAVVCALALPFWPSQPTPVLTVAMPAVAAAGITGASGAIAATLPSKASLPLVSIAWAAGALAMLFYSGCGVALLHLRHRRARVPYNSSLLTEVPLRRTVRVFESTTCDSPITWGLLRPVILLPVTSASWTAEKLRSVLLHELHHIRRWDYLTQLLAQLMRAVYWFHPLAWTCAAALRRESEMACDDAVLNFGQPASDYARHLLDLASSHRSAGIAMARTSHLESRIRSLLNPSIRRDAMNARTRLAGAGVLAALLVLVSGAVIRAQTGAAVIGTVRDMSTAVVPNVEVRIISQDGKRVDLAKSGPDGSFRFNEVPPGDYRIEARSPGFAVLSQTTEVKAGVNMRTLDLQIGKVSETIDVVGKRKAAPPQMTPAGVPQRIRVGGNVQATKIIQMTKPDYPQHLQDQGIEGSVLLEGVISKDGNLLSLHSLSGSVNADLIRAATNAVSQWTYKPTLLNGQPVEVITTITVNFKLAP